MNSIKKRRNCTPATDMPSIHHHHSWLHIIDGLEWEKGGGGGGDTAQHHSTGLVIRGYGVGGGEVQHCGAGLVIGRSGVEGGGAPVNTCQKCRWQVAAKHTYTP